MQASSIDPRPHNCFGPNSPFPIYFGQKLNPNIKRYLPPAPYVTSRMLPNKWCWCWGWEGVRDSADKVWEAINWSLVVHKPAVVLLTWWLQTSLNNLPPPSPLMSFSHIHPWAFTGFFIAFVTMLNCRIKIWSRGNIYKKSFICKLIHWQVFL